jgi:hypothetical protein
MRINLMRSKHRPWYMHLGLNIARWRIGSFPGPPLTISYKPGFFHRDFISYIVRAMAGSGGWTKGEAELFASFVSKLNSCRF